MAASGTALTRSEGQNSRLIGLWALWDKREQLLFLMMRYLGSYGGKMKGDAVREGVITGLLGEIAALLAEVQA